MVPVSFVVLVCVYLCFPAQKKTLKEKSYPENDDSGRTPFESKHTHTHAQSHTNVDQSCQNGIISDIAKDPSGEVADNSPHLAISPTDERDVEEEIRSSQPMTRFEKINEVGNPLKMSCTISDDGAHGSSDVLAENLLSLVAVSALQAKQEQPAAAPEQSLVC